MKKNKIHMIVTIDDGLDKRKYRDFLLEKLRRFNFIRHVNASFGGFSTDVVARDFEQERIYENVPKQVVKGMKDKANLERMKDDLEDMLLKVEEKIEMG